MGDGNEQRDQSREVFVKLKHMNLYCTLPLLRHSLLHWIPPTCSPLLQPKLRRLIVGSGSTSSYSTRSTTNTFPMKYSIGRYIWMKVARMSTLKMASARIHCFASSISLLNFSSLAHLPIPYQKKQLQHFTTTAQCCRRGLCDKRS